MRLAEAVRLARMVRPHHAKKFVQHVVPEVVRPARVIWNQSIGALFLILAVPAIAKAWQLYRGLEANPTNAFGLALSCIFITVMVSFGVASLLKARNIGRRVSTQRVR